MLIALMAACAPSVYKPTVADVECGKKQYADLSLEQLQAGMDLYSVKCGSCHTLYRPQDISRERWDRVLPDMKQEAKLTEEEYQQISRYILVKNSSSTPTKKK